MLRAPFAAFIQTTPGLEPVLQRELESLGLLPAASGPVADSSPMKLERGGIELPMDLEGLMRANLESRTAGKVLLRLGDFPAAVPEMLFDRARKLPWEVHLGFRGEYALRMTSRRSKIQAGGLLARTLTQAIDRRMGELGLSAQLADEAPLTFQVRLLHDRCTISLDTSGEHLHRRGVRTHVHEAPVRETLAAAMLLEGLRGMDGQPDVIVDPFCGSGTLLIEAADLLAGLPPGRNRSFAFEEAAWHRPGRWREVRRVAGALPAGDAVTPAAASGSEATTRILGIDRDEEALAAAGANLTRPEYEGVELLEGDSLTFDFDALGARDGLLVANLPYGVRLEGRREADQSIRKLLRRLQGGRTRWRAALLTVNGELVAEHLGGAESLATRNGGLRVQMVTGGIGGSRSR